MLGSSVHEISQQEYWSGLPFPSPGDLPKSGIEPASPALAGEFFTSQPPGKPQGKYMSLSPPLYGLKKPAHSLLPMNMSMVGPSPTIDTNSLTTRMDEPYVHPFILVAQRTHLPSNDAAQGVVFILKDSELVEKAEIWQWLMQGLLSSGLCYADEFPFYFRCTH